MDSRKNPKPVHLVCPKCRYEFEYDLSYYDRKIAQLGNEIADIGRQLAEFKLTYRQDFHNNEWRKKAVKAMEVKKAQMRELKGFRKVANEITKIQELQIFARLVREAVPEELYVKLHRQAEEEMQYNTYDMARQRFSNIPDNIRENE